MRPLLLLLLGTLGLLPTWVGGAEGTWTQVRIGIEGSGIPMSYYDSRKNFLTGFDVELAREACRRIQVEPVFYNTYWSRIFRDLQEGNIDLVWSGMTITPERARLYSVSKPYYQSRLVAMVHLHSPLKNKKALLGKKIGYLAGSVAEEYLRKDPLLGPDIARGTTQLYPFGGPLDGLLELSFQRVDVLIVDDFSVHALAKADFETMPLRIMATDFGVQSLGFAARRADSLLVKRLEQAVSSMKDDGSLQRLEQVWFNPVFLQRMTLPPETP